MAGCAVLTLAVWATGNCPACTCAWHVAVNIVVERGTGSSPAPARTRARGAARPARRGDSSRRGASACAPCSAKPVRVVEPPHRVSTSANSAMEWHFSHAPTRCAQLVRSAARSPDQLLGVEVHERGVGGAVRAGRGLGARGVAPRRRLACRPVSAKRVRRDRSAVPASSCPRRGNPRRRGSPGHGAPRGGRRRTPRHAMGDGADGACPAPGGPGGTPRSAGGVRLLQHPSGLVVVEVLLRAPLPAFHQAERAADCARCGQVRRASAGLLRRDGVVTAHDPGREGGMARQALAPRQLAPSVVGGRGSARDCARPRLGRRSPAPPESTTWQQAGHDREQRRGREVPSDAGAPTRTKNARRRRATRAARAWPAKKTRWITCQYVKRRRKDVEERETARRAGLAPQEVNTYVHLRRGYGAARAAACGGAAPAPPATSSANRSGTARNMTGVRPDPAQAPLGDAHGQHGRREPELPARRSCTVPAPPAAPPASSPGRTARRELLDDPPADDAARRHDHHGPERVEPAELVGGVQRHQEGSGRHR